MRSQLRNKKYIYYALFDHLEEIQDDYGDGTGDYVPVYQKPVKLACNVSANSGNGDIGIYGISLDYTHIISITFMTCEIKEDSVIWYGIDTDKPYNFVVTKIIKSINNTLILIKEVSTSGDVQYIDN